jgi:UDPglucose 6-dehydrogenase
MKKIAIIGMGVVGQGMFNLFKDRFEVIGYDTKTDTDRTKVMGCDLAIVCVPTNMKPDGSADTSIVEEVVSWLDTPLILIKSKNFTPFWKYADPTDAKKHDFVIVGGNKANDILAYFMKVMAVEAHYTSCTSREAELVKYMENSYFATKVTFCNEFYDIAQALEIDFNKVREMWLLDSRVDRNHTLVFKDERGFGGKCLPKDVNAIVKASEDAGYHPTLLKSVLSTNKRIRNV